MKKILIRFCGAMLIISGFFLIFFLFLSKFVAAPPLASTERWYFVLRLSIPLFMISGVALFSFKEWARKLAIVSCIIALFHLVFFARLGPRLLNENLIFIIIYLCCIAVLACTREQFQDKWDVEKRNKKNRLSIELVIMVSILTLFGMLYSSIISLYYKEEARRVKASKYEESLNLIIKNDTRFREVSFFTSYGGFLDAKGIVRNEEDYQALQDMVSSYKSPIKIVSWRVGTDHPDIEGVPWSRHKHPIILVNIGSVEMLYKERVKDLLNGNSIVNHLRDSQLSSPDACFIYVSPGKKEEAINLLKQDRDLSEKYSQKPDRPDSMKVGSETWVNIGFIEMSHKYRILDLLKTNGIDSFFKSAQFPGYNVCHIYVSPGNKEKAIDLLTRDPVLMSKEEYSPKHE